MYTINFPSSILQFAIIKQDFAFRIFFSFLRPSGKQLEHIERQQPFEFGSLLAGNISSAILHHGLSLSLKFTLFKLIKTQNSIHVLHSLLKVKFSLSVRQIHNNLIFTNFYKEFIRLYKYISLFHSLTQCNYLSILISTIFSNFCDIMFL